ncbi:MAG: tRNA-dihydrouridine synthase family protein [Lentisphaeria bacterium]|nr:tRNA-dihydrouridine synthase family protein [Lentisphaeria bacterium]
MSSFLWLPGPMEGVMSPEWVRAANSLHLAERWITPFFRLSQELPRRKYFASFLEPYKPVPTVMQLMGTDPGLLAEAACIAEAEGAAGVDFNFGCPSSQVLRHGAGGGILKKPELAGMILRRTLAAVKIPVSVKIRCGWERPEELPELLAHLLAEGPAMLTFHFRCVSEGYLPLAPEERARRFRMAAELAGERTCLILNGDFSAAEEMRSAVKQYPVGGVMAARGFLRDPGLLRRAAGEEVPPPDVLREAFFRAVIQQYPEGMPPGRAIELSIFLWGKDNPCFQKLRGRREPVRLETI